MSQLIGAASGYEEVLYDVRIPSLTDTANIVEAFKAYHFGLDNFNGDVEPAANSIHSWLKDFDERIVEVEASTTLTLTGTANEVNVSGSVGSIIVGLPDDVVIGRDLTITRDLYVSDDLQVSDNLTVLGAAIFASTASAMSTLRVNGAATLDSTLFVDGVTTLDNTVNINGNTNILNSASVAQNLIVSGSANIVGNTNITGNTTISGRLDVAEIVETISDSTISGGVLTANYNDANIFYVGTAPSANFTVNVTNAPTDDLRTFTITVITTQGATGYIPNVLQVAGSPITIRWAYGVTPTPTSNAGDIDIFNFTLIRRSSAWVVLGSSNLDF